MDTNIARAVKDRLRIVGLMRRIYRRYVLYRRHVNANAVIVSFPKSGRTWVRVMIGKVLSEISGKEFTIHLERFGGKSVPYIYATHDRPVQSWKPISRTARRYGKKKVVLLVRDPRDVVVSYFFHCTKRHSAFSGDLSEFIRDEQYGVDEIIDFMNAWHSARGRLRELLVVRYEDLQLSAELELANVVEFLGIPDVDEKVIESAVAFGSLENMLAMEKQGRLEGSATNLRDRETYKVRRGAVGGYIDYLSDSDRQYVEGRVRKRLAVEFGY